MGKTCVICGKPSGMYPLCKLHLQMKNDGKVIKCEDCGTWHLTNAPCVCKKSVTYTELPTEGFETCVSCGAKTNGYAFCRKCFKKYTNDEMLDILNGADSDDEIFLDDDEVSFDSDDKNEELQKSKKCLLCEKESGEFIFCKSCFARYRNKTLLLKITVAKDQELELLDESYEGLYTCKDGHVVKSKSERDIDNYLFEHKIAHAYEKALVINSEVFHPDFYLPELDVYLEHWGYDESNLEYTKRKEYKIPKYKEKGITLISTYEKDMKDVDTSLDIKLSNYKKGEINLD